MNSDSLIGQRFGMLTIIGEGEPYISPGGAKYRTCRCRCDCGNIRDVRLSRLKRDQTYSCGCTVRRPREYRKTSDESLIGQKINLFTVLEETDPYIAPDGTKYRRYNCRCECGNIRKIPMSELNCKRRYSCGCRRRQVIPRKPKDLLDDPAVRASVVVDIQREMTVGQTYRFGDYDYVLIQKFSHVGLFLDPFGRHECFDWWTVQKTIRYGGMPDTFRFWARHE